MAAFFSGPSSWVGALVASAASVLAWVARVMVKRIDKLESTVVTRTELNDLMDARAQADAERGRDIQRLEGKIDAYQSVITARIDRLLERRDIGR
jgi:hypothetical protein